eukprot:symbB.v1.2.007440.t1/scaffold445.1/size204899/3
MSAVSGEAGAAGAPDLQAEIAQTIETQTLLSLYSKIAPTFLGSHGPISRETTRLRAAGARRYEAKGMHRGAEGWIHQLHLGCAWKRICMAGGGEAYVRLDPGSNKSGDTWHVKLKLPSGFDPKGKSYSLKAHPFPLKQMCEKPEPPPKNRLRTLLACARAPPRCRPLISTMRGRMAMGRTFGGEGFHCLRDELMPPPTPLSHRDVASEGPRCYIGVCTFQNQGKNSENQDAYIATENGTKSLVAVLDGKRVSEFARAQLAKNLYASKELYTKPAMAMENAYAETQRGIERSHAIDAQRSGTTAVACYRHRDHLVVANVGDSRAVLGRCSSREGEAAAGLRAVDLSSDQRPMREDERSRIVQQGGLVHQSAIPMRQGFGPPVLVRVGPERVWDKTGRCGLCVTRRNSIDFTCSGCGDSFSSRNALFRHLRYHGCGSGIRRRSRRTLVLYGYVGSRFHGSQLNNVADEERFPTVEGALLEAIRQAHLNQPHVSACAIEVCSRASRTDKGVHALASAVCLRITQECDSEFEDLQQSFTQMVGNYLPEDIAVVQAFDVPDPEFNARFACQKREYWYYVPYHHLLKPAEQQIMQKLQMDGMLSTDPLACQVWVSGLPETTSNEDLIDLVIKLGKVDRDALLDVQFSRKDGSAILVFADSATALSLCWKMDGAEGPLDAKDYRAPLLALPQSVMCKLQEVHKRLRSSLKKLTGTKSFHNFSPGFSNASDPKSIRSVYRCRSGVTTGFRAFLSGRAFAVLRIVGRDFLYHQIRGMVGMVCALTLGVVPDAYLDLALSDEVHIEVPLAPAGNLVLAECFFRDGCFGCPFGQAVREERDKAGGRRGDLSMHPFVIAQPEVSERTLCSKDKVLILGSDGVWDRINSQEAVDIAAKHTDPNAAAREIASIARQRWHAETQGQLSDDITAVVMHLDHEPGMRTSPVRPSSKNRTLLPNPSLPRPSLADTTPVKARARRLEPLRSTRAERLGLLHLPAAGLPTRRRA